MPDRLSVCETCAKNQGCLNIFFCSVAAMKNNHRNCLRSTRVVLLLAGFNKLSQIVYVDLKLHVLWEKHSYKKFHTASLAPGFPRIFQTRDHIVLNIPTYICFEGSEDSVFSCVESLHQLWAGSTWYRTNTTTSLPHKL